MRIVRGQQIVRKHKRQVTKNAPYSQSLDPAHSESHDGPEPTRQAIPRFRVLLDWISGKRWYFSSSNICIWCCL